MLLLGSAATFADDDDDKSYTLQGPCAYLPADRATEFHGNPEEAELLLGMAGNQWVVFDKVMQGFNRHRGVIGNNAPDKQEPQHHDNQVPDNKGNLVDYWTLDKLNEDARQYYIQLIPPGQIRKQIKSGCLVLGNDEERNFLPSSIQVDFDVFASTNYNLMQDLANNGFVREAAPYIKNKLDLMVAEGNPKGVGTGGAPGTYAHIYDIVMDLLDDCDHDVNGCIDGADPGIVVSEVDHINEGVHNAINKMYQAMDVFIRANAPAVDADMNGVPDDVDALDTALAAVSMPQPGSPAATRSGVSTNFDLATNSACNKDGHLQLCEFAILNKSNTHETRVHHVETPNGILGVAGYAPVDVGPVWISELGYQLVRNVPVEGMQPGAFPPPGVEGPAGSGINTPATYSIAILATAENPELAQQFIDFVRSPEGQTLYTDGGFLGLSAEELNGGKCYAVDGMASDRDGSCP
jgi:hypothetical protein